MTALSIILPLLGFIVVAIGGRAFSLHLRRRGHGAALDAIELRAREVQLKIMRNKAIVLRSIQRSKRKAHQDSADID